MMKIRQWALVAGAVFILSGCGSTSPQSNPMADLMSGKSGGSLAQMDPEKMMGAMTEKMNFSQEMMKNPDLPVWHAHREKMALAVGDRVFDKGFERTFESMITALASLGCRVNNIERNSGFITASLPQLPPDQQELLQTESKASYAQIKGFSPAVLQKAGPMGFDMDFGAMMERGGGAGLTLSMVKQGARQTKVKLRFDGVFYPRQIDALYKMVWAEVDKQMFLDRALD